MKALWKMLARRYLKELVAEWFERDGDTLWKRLIAANVPPILAEAAVLKARDWALERAAKV